MYRSPYIKEFINTRQTMAMFTGESQKASKLQQKSIKKTFVSLNLYHAFLGFPAFSLSEPKNRQGIYISAVVSVSSFHLTGYVETFYCGLPLISNINLVYLN